MASNNGTNLNLFKYHNKEEWSTPNIQVDEVNEEIIKTETVVVGGLWVPENVDSNELLQNKNENGNQQHSAEQLTKNPVCQSCKMEYKDYCMNCGHLLHILDNEMEVRVRGRAMLSVPKSILEIKGSILDGYGVFALRNIPKGVKFGPYEGLETLNRRNKYLWKIRYAKLVEAKGEDYCNWMRYIDYATTQYAQNLTALQFMGEIYYKTLKEIKTGEELLINYSSSGYDDMGVHTIQYFQPEVEEINKNIFKCPPCYFGFSEEKYLVNHNKECPFKKNRVFEVNGGSGIKAFEDDSRMCERINKLKTHCQKYNENGRIHKKVGFDGKEEVLEQDLIENVTIIKEEKETLKFPHSGDDCRSIDALKKQMSQNKYCEEDVILNHAIITMKSNRATEKRYKCNDCSYAAVQKCDFLSHMKHCPTVEKPFKCNECTYAAKRKHNLAYHVKSRHTMEKPYKCGECSYAAVEKFMLLYHIKSRHTIQKSYKCNQCTYTGMQKGNLLHHIKSHHTMEKPYNCNECAYATVRKDNLVYHIKSHHTMEKPYKCHDLYSSRKMGASNSH